MTTGIPAVNLDYFVEVLKKTLKLSDGACDELKTMAYAGGKEKLVVEVAYDSEFESRYGYIAMTKNFENNTISCIYAFHNLTFKLAPKRIEVRKRGFLWKILGEGRSVSYEPVRLGTKDIEAIKSTYMRYKALESLRKEGIIHEITFE